MSSIVGRPILAGPESRQRLALVTAREESELARVAFPDTAQPFGGNAERLLPFNLDKITAATRADTFQGFG